jgi:hypothetical protein
MTVNAEIKGQLARLLATEDLIVEHRKVPTASFDIERRVLTLPLWNRASGTVYDLLVGHEVGHALFTPNEDWREKIDVPQQFVNVVEDVRIEKMMKKKYPGLSKTFFKGYKELSDDDFFSIKDENLYEMNLADRVNLHCKIGNFVAIPFNNEELEILNIIENTQTFDEVLKVAEILYKYCKKEKEEKQKESLAQNQNQDSGSSGSSDEQQGQNDSSDSLDYDQNGSQSDSDLKNQQPQPQQQQSQSDPQNGGGENDEDLEVKTDSNLSDKIENLTDKSSFDDTVYVEIPKIDTKKAVVKNKEVHDYIFQYFQTYADNLKNDLKERGYEKHFIDPYHIADSKFIEFKRSAQKEVNYLVKEFECRKSADSYARSTVSRSGVLDTSKLHTYKYNEDLFKKVTVIPDGKNHGLIFVLDWSGSISDVLLDTCKQMYNLLWFCKKVNIPFEVYAFTNEWAYYDLDENYAHVLHKRAYEEKENLICVAPEFRLMNLFTSKTNAKDLDQQMKHIWRIAFSYANRYSTTCPTPDRLTLSGTPLNESIITLSSIIPEFKKEFKVQKVQCIILTDGEACGITYHKKIKRISYYSNEVFEYLGHVSIRYGMTYLRDRKLGTTYNVGNGFTGMTEALLRNIRDKFEDVNFVGIRILEGRDFTNFISRYQSDCLQIDNLRQQWKKNRSIVIRNSSYHAYFGLSSSALSNGVEFEVQEDATKTQIKKAFVKSLGAKKLNKKVLSEFMNLIA